MKKTIITVILVLTMLFCFVSCNNTEQEETTTKDIVLLIVEEEEELARYEREVDYENLAEFLFSLTREEDSEFQYESSTSAYGQYVNSVTVSTNSETGESEGLFPDDANNEFVALYHTLDDEDNRDYTIEPFTINDTEFYLSANGITKTPLVDGAEYMFKICSY